MEKSRPEILSEIQETLAELKARIAEIESKLTDLEQFAEEPEEVVVEEPAPVEESAPVEDLSPIDISIDDAELSGTDTAAPEPEEAPAPAAAPIPAPAPAPAPAPLPEAEPETEPFGGLLDEEFPAAPRASINDRQERRAKKAVMDVMGQKLAWKTAIPGTPVKNIISAISLNDRVLFINTLFKEDPMAFQEAITAFNGMSSFDEAEEYVRARHPEWNLNSDLVFRLMMAVRRKLK